MEHIQCRAAAGEGMGGQGNKDTGAYSEPGGMEGVKKA